MRCWFNCATSGVAGDMLLFGADTAGKGVELWRWTAPAAPPQPLVTGAFVRVLATGDPALQQALELRVEKLFDDRGIAHQWGPEDGLDEVKEHRFG